MAGWFFCKLYDALAKIRSPEEIAAKRGKSLEEITG